MPSANDVIKRSLRLIGAIASGETPAADMAQDALTTLQALQDEWQLDPLNMIATVREVFSVTANVQDYTIGPLADFARDFTPIDIDAAALLLASSTPPDTEIPLSIWTEQQWQAQLVKPLTNTLFTGLKYERETSTGLGLISLWPIPTTAVNSIVLYLNTPVPRFPNLSTVVTLAQGYENAYVYQLAIELAPEYGKPIDTIIRERATEALARIKRANNQPVELGLDPALWPMATPTYNIQTDS